MHQTVPPLLLELLGHINHARVNTITNQYKLTIQTTFKNYNMELNESNCILHADTFELVVEDRLSHPESLCDVSLHSAIAVSRELGALNSLYYLLPTSYLLLQASHFIHVPIRVPLCRPLTFIIKNTQYITIDYRLYTHGEVYKRE